MKSFNKLIVLFSFLFITHSLFSQQRDSYFLHTVEKGQNIYSISSMYGVTQKDIIKLNPGSEKTIYAGQTLKIPQALTSNMKETFHTIAPGETLYRLTITYNIPAKTITDANPGLSAENFKAGEVIRIPIEEDTPEATAKEDKVEEIEKPKCKDMHKVKRKETIFSISRKYKLTEEELIAANPEIKKGLKKGAWLCIPYSSEEKETEAFIVDVQKTPPTNIELFNQNKETPHRISTINTAIILPFMLDGGRKQEALRMVEYYEGFLMAVDSLKQRGANIELHVFDSKNDPNTIKQILNKKELQEMDIIFGPLHQQNVKLLADFSKQHNIRLVVPFTSKDDEVFNNPSIYQINTPQSYLYSEVFEHLTRQFPNANLIVLETTSGKDQYKKEFIEGLNTMAKKNNFPIKTVNIDNIEQSLPTVESLIRTDKTNLFIPSSGSDAALNKVVPLLQLIKGKQIEAPLHLFGYPEWQTYTSDRLQDFFDLDTYFYSSFYTNNLLPAAKNFVNGYHKWYKKEMINTYPKYGMLGFDTAFYFLHGLATYGTDLENNLDRIDLTPIQTGFKFERVSNWGGFVNKKVFFVRFTNNYELIKLDFD
ncbi:MAG: LysM peptidoglycan-binding domain-containing protein [Bacteroidales bacterium]|nr:LysM peptidoglycan-binding domain-containing protein [Bacteroidales bacterium]